MKRHTAFASSLLLIVVLAISQCIAPATAAVVDCSTATDAAAAQSMSSTSETVVLCRGCSGYDGVQDAYILQDSSDPHGGASEQMVHIKESSYGSKRGLMYYDLTSIPHYMDVTEARLEIYVNWPWVQSATPVSLYHLLRPWDEDAATWFTTGYASWTLGGASAAGNDYEATPFATATIPTGNGYFTIDVTDAVQRWVSDSSSNNGFMIKGGSSADVRFWSSERTTDVVPRLVVTYELPPDVTPEPTHTLTPTRTPTNAPTATATPAAMVSSWGYTEAFGAEYPNCIEAGPLAANPDHTEIYFVWEGEPTMAQFRFWYSGNNDRYHSVLVNDQIVGVLPGNNYRSVCTGGSEALLDIDPAVVANGDNKISIVADVEGELNSWGLQSPQLILGGNVVTPDIEVVEIESSYDSTTQRAMVQKPIGLQAGIRTPLVVALHGWGARDFDALKWLGQAVNDRGWILAASDTRNDNQHTASKAVQHDVIDLIKYLEASPDYTIDSDRIYIVGTSMGGMMAATVAAKYPHYFAALAERSGPTRLDQWYNETEAWRQNVIAAELNGTPNNTPFSYQRKSAAAMPMNLRNVPTIIIHGTDDTIVPYHHAEDLYSGMVAYGAQSVALYPYAGGHEDSHPDWGPAEILDFFAQHELNETPDTVTVRTDEPKDYYWLDVDYVASDHWTQVNASYDLDSKTIVVDVLDERSSPTTVDVTLDLVAMGLPTGVSYTVEDSNITNGYYSQSTVDAGSRYLKLSVHGDQHEFVAYPFAANPPQEMTLQQGVNGYGGAQDTYIEIHAVDTNHASDGLRLTNGGGRVPLLRFNLDSLPAGVSIKSAQLGVYLTSKWREDDSSYAVMYRLLQDWDVGTVTWNSRTATQGWSSPGAMAADTDYDPSSYGDQWLDDTGQWYYYNATGLVKEWVDGTHGNYGLLLRGEDGTGTLTLNSSESPNYQPKLVITYAEPTPTPNITSTPSATPTVTPSPTRSGRLYLPVIQKG